MPAPCLERGFPWRPPPGCRVGTPPLGVPRARASRGAAHRATSVACASSSEWRIRHVSQHHFSWPHSGGSGGDVMRMLFVFLMLLSVAPAPVHAQAESKETSSQEYRAGFSKDVFVQICKNAMKDLSKPDMLSLFDVKNIDMSHVRLTTKSATSSGEVFVFDAWCEFKDGLAVRYKATWR